MLKQVPKFFGVRVFKLIFFTLCFTLCFTLYSCLTVADNISTVTYFGERLHINQSLTLYTDDDKSLPVIRGQIDSLLNEKVKEDKVIKEINHLYVFDLLNTSENNAVQLELKGSIIDKIELYVFDGEGLVHVDVTGYLFPRRGHSYVLNIPYDPNESVRVVVSLDSRYKSGPINMYLENPGLYQERSLNIYAIVYICLGGMLFLGLYNLILCFGLRDKSYLFYSLYLFSMVVGWATVFSLLMRHYEISYIGFSLIPFYMGPIFSGLFLISFLELTWKSHKILLFITSIGIVLNIMACLVFPFVDDFGFYFKMLMYNSGLYLLLALYAGIVRLLEGFKPARFFIMGFSIMALGGVFAILPGLGVRVDFLIEDYYVVTLLSQSLDMLFLAIALADKINVISSEKNKAVVQFNASNLKVLEVERDANRTLVEANFKLKQSLDIADQQDKKKQHFLMLASHELKTPLNMVLQAVIELKGDAYTPIKQGVARLSIVVDEMTLFSQICTGKLKPVKARLSVDFLLNSLLKNSESFLKGKHIVITPDIKDVIDVDSHLLSMVLKPLLDNACKFSKQNVSISYSYDDAGFTTWVFEDDGEGLNTLDMSFLMEAFTQKSQGLTREKEGLGLGLYIAKKALEPLGGEMKFSTSSRFKGACVEVTVPCDKVDRISLTNKEIRLALIVEDNPINAKVLTAMLAKMNIQSDVAVNGQEALDIVLEKKFDVVFMDLQMPIMDGLTATQELKNRNYPTPIIAVTANTEANMREKCIALGMVDVLPKPIRIADIKGSLLRLE